MGTPWVSQSGWTLCQPSEVGGELDSDYTCFECSQRVPNVAVLHPLGVAGGPLVELMPLPYLRAPFILATRAVLGPLYLALNSASHSCSFHGSLLLSSSIGHNLGTAAVDIIGYM
eukprot:COSAG02_NODE_3975_length_5965_cov_5.092226_8_plen_115_part_00